MILSREFKDMTDKSVNKIIVMKYKDKSLFLDNNLGKEGKTGAPSRILSCSDKRGGNRVKFQPSNFERHKAAAGN